MPNKKEKTVLEEAHEDFKLFYSDNEAYKTKVDTINDLFGLTEECKLKNDYLPTYFVGDTKANCKYGLFSLNPGFGDDNKVEESWKNESWDKYLNFTKNFFTLFYNSGRKSRYYTMIAKIFGGLDNTLLQNNYDIYNYYQNNLINVDLIPYHSARMSLPNNFTNNQKIYLKKRLNSNVKMLKKVGVNIIIFNGKPLFTLLYENGFIDNSTVKTIKGKKAGEVDIYFFHLDNVPCILFAKFITSVHGLSSNDFNNIIPNLISDWLTSSNNTKYDKDTDNSISNTNYLDL